MKPMLEELEQALDTQLRNLVELERVLRSQRESLLARNVAGILESINAQGQTLERIQQLETQRHGIVARLAAGVGLGAQTTLEQLAKRFEPPVRTKLLSSREALRTRLETIRQLNQENQRLIQHALEVVQGLMGALTGSGPAKRVYEASGTLKPSPQMRALVDQTT